jgi:hypothetical protein
METRGITVKVPVALQEQAKQEAEAKEQTMSQFIEAVLTYYFNRGDEKEMNGNKKTLAFQVSEEFYTEVHEFIKANKMTLKNFGIEAMRRMIAEAPAAEPPADDTGESDQNEQE